MRDGKLDRDLILKKLRKERDVAAANGDHGEALVLNDRINLLKSGEPLTVEWVMREFESALARRRFYNPRPN